MKSSIPFLLLLCVACSSREDPPKRPIAYHQSGEYIHRTHDSAIFQIPAPTLFTPEPYPWQQGHVGKHLKITKEFFRCKGSSVNPTRTNLVKNEVQRYCDCGGSTKHSLPLRDGKEFVYTILIDLLNFIQAKTHQRVVITSGHRCPEHNSYVDPSSENQFSKHQIGAEVSFYVQGLENQPEKVVELIQKFYKETKKYQEKKEFIEFQRYQKNDAGVITAPWFNKEIFVKLFNKKEGRNFDNRHPYPYISIQVRYDIDRNERVAYSWEKATQNYLRY